MVKYKPLFFASILDVRLNIRLTCPIWWWRFFFPTSEFHVSIFSRHALDRKRSTCCHRFCLRIFFKIRWLSNFVQLFFCCCCHSFEAIKIFFTALFLDQIEYFHLILFFAFVLPFVFLFFFMTLRFYVLACHTIRFCQNGVWHVSLMRQHTHTHTSLLAMFDWWKLKLKYRAFVIGIFRLQQ